MSNERLRHTLGSASRLPMYLYLYVRANLGNSIPKLFQACRLRLGPISPPRLQVKKMAVSTRLEPRWST